MSTAEMVRWEYGTLPGSGREEIRLPLERLSDPGDHSEWRVFMAERIAMEMDYSLFGVKTVYLIGSVESREAGPGSDIDLVFHIGRITEKTRLLHLWLDGWNKSLALQNYFRTGYLADGLLDVHIVTDRDVREGDSFAVAMQNPARSRCLTCRS